MGARLRGAITAKQKKKESGEGWKLSGRSGNECRRAGQGEAGKGRGNGRVWPGRGMRRELRQQRMDRGSGSVGWPVYVIFRALQQ